MQHLDRDGSTLRVLLATLKLSTAGEALDPERIAFVAGVSEKAVQTVLSKALELDALEVSVSPALRLRLAMEIAKVGQFVNAAKALTWQEFERFAGECLEESGFEAKRNVRVKGEGRAWQIDVVGFRGELVLAIDCKHWNTPSYLSRFKLAANHQRQASSHLLTTLREKASDGSKRLQALAVILTLREPPAQLSEKTVLVSVEKLPSFLSGVTPYDENLPFITSSLSLVENPMSQAS